MTELRTASPESAGISSAAVSSFFNRLIELELNLHGIIVLRNGKRIAEGYWPPHDKDRKHIMFSQSKSLTSLAVGFLIDEGKLSLDSKIVDFFPEFVRPGIHPWLLETTVRHMLMMTDPHSFTTYAPEEGPVLTAGWAKSWFDIPPSHRPGQVFHYNTSCTYMLDAIIEKLAGMPFMDYLRPRLFDHIGVSSDAYCMPGPDGYSAGGSSVRCTVRDMATVGQFCLQEGNWNGKQLLSAAYIKAATSRQIDNSITDDVRTHFETHQGYGYQMWKIRNDGFMFYGLHGQLTLCFPNEQLVVAATGDTNEEGSIQEFIHTVFGHLVPACTDTPLPEDEAARASLQSLTAKLPAGRYARPSTPQILNTRTYYFDGNNETGISTLTISANETHVDLALDGSFPPRRLRCGIGTYHTQPGGETFLFGGQSKHIGHDLSVAATWADDRTLLIDFREDGEALGRQCLNLTFDGADVTIFASKGGGVVMPGLRHGIATGTMR